MEIWPCEDEFKLVEEEAKDVEGPGSRRLLGPNSPVFFLLLGNEDDVIAALAEASAS